MKKYLILFLILIFSQLLLPAQDQVQAIREVILEAYVRGAYNEGIVRNLELGYHKDFRAIGLRKGKDTVLTLQAWIQDVKKGKAEGRYPRSSEEQVSVRFDDIDIYGDLASTKLTRMIGNKPHSIDILDLYKYPGGWLIVNKTYQEIERQW